MINELDQWLTVTVVSKLERISERAVRKRISSGKYPNMLINRISKPTGGYYYEIHVTALSLEARQQIKTDSDASTPLSMTTNERKERSDKGTSSVDDKILYRSAAIVTTARASSHERLKKNFGYKKGYDKFKEMSKAEGTPIVSYRRFIDLAKPLVDKQVQEKLNLGPVRFRQKEMTMKHDYSGYEPMQFLQNDHTQFDVMCLHNGNAIRPWASFHNSVGDRVLSYPTIVQRPDSYSLADDLSNFVYQYGLSQNAVIYKSDHGKAQKSLIMTKGGFTEVELKPFDIDEAHLKVMNLMNVGLSHDKGIIQNLGMIETHSTARLPRTKLLERNFGIGGTMEWFVDRPEYTGRKYQEAPEALAKRVKGKNLWTSEEMIDFVMNKVDEYNNRTHSAIKEQCKGIYAIPHTYNLDVEFFQKKSFARLFGGVIPNSLGDVAKIFNDETWSKKVLNTNLYSPMWRRKIYEMCGWVSRALPARETLAMLAMGYVERTIHHYGIELNTNLYINLKLQKYIGKKVICRYHPSNVVRIREDSGKEKIFFEELFVFDKASEEFLCIAEPHPRTMPGIRPEGYAKKFLINRGLQTKEINTAAKITSEIAAGKYDEVKREDTPIFQLQTSRDIASKKMELEKLNKEQKKNSKAKEDENDLKIAEAIFGKRIQLGDGE